MVCLGLEPGAAGWKAQTNQHLRLLWQSFLKLALGLAIHCYGDSIMETCMMLTEMRVHEHW